MWTIFKKEIISFLTSLSGFLVLGIFVLTTGLLLWVFPTGINIPENGYANLNGLFIISPFLFLFLVPAVSMKSFSDEYRTGTIELLLTRPIRTRKIILGKYLAIVLLIILSLVPTLIYYLSVYILAYPVGNIDSGSIWGSYAGLLFLGAVFASIGIFASSITQNQIIAFLLAILISAFFYLGFQLISPLSGNLAFSIDYCGIAYHYQSISRGVIDIRDIIYFLTLIWLFLFLTEIRINKIAGKHNVNSSNKKFKFFINENSGISIILGLIFIFFLNWISSNIYLRIDLTSDKRFTLSTATKKTLKALKEPVIFNVYLKGEDLPASFKRLQRETKEMLEEFQAYNSKIHFRFINPSSGTNFRQKNKVYQFLSNQGLNPTNLQVKTKEGLQQKIIFPGILVSSKNKTIPIHLLNNEIGIPPELVLNHSVENIEYKLTKALYTLTLKKKPMVAFLKGQKEISGAYIADFKKSLLKDFRVININISKQPENKLLRKDKISGKIVPTVKTLIIAKPTKTFNEQDKFALDQYIMYGGKILWLIDPVLASMDSIKNSDATVSIDMNLGIQELLFHYGVRLNKDLILDLNATSIPVKTGEVEGRSQISLLPWYYFPLISSESKNPIVKNINSIQLQFASSIDTLPVKDVKKTILLKTSPYVATEKVPGIISLSILGKKPKPGFFREPAKNVAVLLQGHFSSDFNNRIIPQNIDVFPFKKTSNYTKMIIVSDGDIIRNQLQIPGKEPLPLGYDQYTRITYGNKQFLLNAIEYLSQNSNLITLRARILRLRMLDKVKLNKQLLQWQLINVVTPVIILIIIQLSLSFIRKKRYHNKNH